MINCIKALRWILKNRNQALIEPRLLKLHTLMAKGLLPARRCGQYRDIQNYIVNAKNKVIYTPPSPAKVIERMNSLLTWTHHKQQEHPIVRSAIFHHEFVAIHPFVDGNGRVARAAAQWLLFEKDQEPLYTLGLDEFFAQDRSRYYDMIQQTHDLDGDYTYWIEYVAQGLLESVQAMAKRIKNQKISYKGKKIKLTPKQEELLKMISEHGSVGSIQICQQMKINRSRVNQLIAPLIKAGFVIREGNTRAAKYTLA